jgi:hypothetical protein
MLIYTIRTVIKLLLKIMKPFVVKTHEALLGEKLQLLQHPPVPYSWQQSRLPVSEQVVP